MFRYICKRFVRDLCSALVLQYMSLWHDNVHIIIMAYKWVVVSSIMIQMRKKYVILHKHRSGKRAGSLGPAGGKNDLRSLSKLPEGQLCWSSQPIWANEWQVCAVVASVKISINPHLSKNIFRMFAFFIVPVLLFLLLPQQFLFGMKTLLYTKFLKTIQKLCVWQQKTKNLH